jgi:hypothetical protein
MQLVTLELTFEHSERSLELVSLYMNLESGSLFLAKATLATHKDRAYKPNVLEVFRVRCLQVLIGLTTLRSGLPRQSAS